MFHLFAVAIVLGLFSLGHCFYVYLHLTLTSAVCRLAKTGSSVDGEPQGVRTVGGIQIPQTCLQALLTFSHGCQSALRELARWQGYLLSGQ